MIRFSHALSANSIRTRRPEKNHAFFSPAYEIGAREKMKAISPGYCHCGAGFCPP